MGKEKQITPQRITSIPIWPSTNVRSTQGDRWLFSVSDEYLEAYDIKRLEETGKVGRNLHRKRQLEKYNAYKEELQFWAEKNTFSMPSGFFSIWFYLPAPRSWRKKKLIDMLYAPHTSTPDLDNLIKALFDGIMPRRNRIGGGVGADDRRIHCYTAFKIWVPSGEERIDIVEYNQDQYLSLFKYQ